MNLAPLPFSLRQLQYVIAVADLRNFRRAAERCHVSQPALSSQLAELESVLGVQLFERSRSGVIPTPAGEALVERARRLLVEADEFREAAQRLGDPLSGPVRLGVIPTLAPYLLPWIAPPLRARFERLSVQWIEEKTSTLMERLREGRLDGALLALEAELGDVEQAVIGRDAFVLATAGDDPLGKRAGPARWAELDHASLLLLDDGHCLRSQVLSACQSKGTTELAFRATSLPTLVQMLGEGGACTLLPQLAVETETRHVTLAIRPLAAPAPYRTIGLVWRPRSAFAPALQAIAQTMRDSYQKRFPDPESVSKPSRSHRRAT